MSRIVHIRIGSEIGCAALASAGELVEVAFFDADGEARLTLSLDHATARDLASAILTEADLAAAEATRQDARLARTPAS